MSFQVSFTSASHSPKLNQSFAWELKNLSNEKLVIRLKEQVSQERKLQMKVLSTLQEVEVRRLHLQMDTRIFIPLLKKSLAIAQELLTEELLP